MTISPDEGEIQVQEDLVVWIRELFTFSSVVHGLICRDRDSTTQIQHIMMTMCMCLRASIFSLHGELTGPVSESSTRSVTSSIYDYENSHGRTYHAVRSN